MRITSQPRSTKHRVTIADAMPLPKSRTFSRGTFALSNDLPAWVNATPPAHKLVRVRLISKRDILRGCERDESSLMRVPRSTYRERRFGEPDPGNQENEHQGKQRI